MVNRTFEFPHHHEREEQPRGRGNTAIRGPYYDPIGPCELRDLLETTGQDVAIEVPHATVPDTWTVRTQ